MPAPGEACHSSAPRPRGRIRAAALALAVGAAMLAACRPSLDWRRVDVDAGVQLLFPCKVERRDRTRVPFGDRPFDVRQYACEAGGMTFVAMVVPFDISVPAAVRQDVERVLRAGVAANVGAAADAPQPAASAAASSSGSTVTGPSAGLAAGGAAQTGDIGAAATRRPTPQPWPVLQGRRPDGQAVAVHAASWQGPAQLLHLAVVGDRPEPAAVAAFFEGLEVAR